MDIMLFACLFFFKQKTAYEVRISDWSSDVCSSDLVIRADSPEEMIALACAVSVGALPEGDRVAIITTSGGAGGWAADICEEAGLRVPPLNAGFKARSEERRVGTECVSTCRPQWSPYP